MKINNKEESRINKVNKFKLLLGIIIVNIIGIAIILYIIFNSSILNTNITNSSLKFSKINKGIIMNHNVNLALSVSDFKSKINKDYILIDIRTPGEINMGVIPGVDLFIDFYSDSFKFEIMKLDNTKKYLIYCAHANRTKSLLYLMQKMNFKDVYELEGGIVNWVVSGEKIIKRAN